ncbi:MAG: hypothetical protein JOY71_09975, partial [Acetobacteraceae bacterium]|nr:hypothetical protein [Acetobacteraceae bacterium]
MDPSLLTEPCREKALEEKASLIADRLDPQAPRNAFQTARPRAPIPSIPGNPAWRDRCWVALMGRIDAMLRWVHGVSEFSDDPRCALRFSVIAARRPVVLADDARIERGEPICVLHLWNERIPKFPQTGPDLRWANAARQLIRDSLNELAKHLDLNPALKDVRAIYACLALPNRLASQQAERLAEKFGFAPARSASPMPGQYDLGHSMLMWGLARAFN